MPLGARQGALVVGRQDGHGLGRAAHLGVFITKYKNKHCGETKISVTELTSGPLVRFSPTEEVPGTGPRAVRSHPEQALLLDPENVAQALVMACSQGPARLQENRKKRKKKGRKGTREMEEISCVPISNHSG